MLKIRTPLILLIIASACTIYIVSLRFVTFPVNDAQPQSNAELQKSFLRVALETGTDKVTDHHYNIAYQKYLPSLRESPIKMLEIGLGCDMRYGPGASYHLWLRYFTNPASSIRFMEYDKKCARAFSTNISPQVRIFGGDQSKVEDLQQMIDEFGIDQYDFIVDDGGHTMEQQIVSLKFLLKYVKPGGFYFLEDLQTSYHGGYGGGYLKSTTTIEYIKDLIDRFYIGDHELIGLIESIDCYHELCVFTRKLE